MGPTRTFKRARPISTTPPKKKAKATPRTHPFENPSLVDTSLQGKHVLEWLLHPIPLQKFFSKYFEKKPRILHNDANKFRTLVSLPLLRALVTSGKLQYGELDVTSYTASGGRETHNGEGRVGKEAWRRYESGCSLRLRRPQTHIDGIYKLCAHMEEFLECVVGANVYLTPPESQGFAPHFDDVDAFVCQVSGEKHWKVYAGRADGLDKLPRQSSIDFNEEEMKEATVAVDAVLRAGDVLYLPRGATHEARCTQSHSLHVTVSMFQKWTWADLLLESFGAAVRSAAAEDVALRRTLPLRFGRFVGAGAGAAGSEHQERFHGLLEGAVKRVAKRYPSDAAADVLAARFMRERLPPPVKGGGGKVTGDAAVRAVGAGVARVVIGDDGLPRMVSCVANRRDGGGESIDVACLPDEALAVDMVVREYPQAVRVADIPLDEERDRVELCEGLVEMGVAEVVSRGGR